MRTEDRSGRAATGHRNGIVRAVRAPKSRSRRGGFARSGPPGITRHARASASPLHELARHALILQVHRHSVHFVLVAVGSGSCWSSSEDRPRVTGPARAPPTLRPTRRMLGAGTGPGPTTAPPGHRPAAVRRSVRYKGSRRTEGFLARHPHPRALRGHRGLGEAPGARRDLDGGRSQLLGGRDRTEGRGGRSR